MPINDLFGLVTLKSFASMEVEKGERSDISTITTSSVDSDGDIVLIDGIDLEPWQDAGSPVYYAHKSLKVGHCLWTKKSAETIKAKTKYDHAPSNWKSDKPFVADVIWDAVQKGILPGKSVTLLPKDCDEPTKEQKAAGVRRIIRTSMLAEFSVCKTPVNGDAIVEEIHKALTEEPTVNNLDEIANSIKRAFDELRGRDR